MSKVKLVYLLFCLACCFCVCTKNASAQKSVGINTDHSNPDPSAVLDVKSTTKGVVFPRMTEAQRNAISSPVQGLLVYQTNGKKGYYYYRGSAWKQISSQQSSAAAGTIIAFGGDHTKVPVGWKLCDGTAVSRTDAEYKSLFAAIGTAWGTGDGSTTFNLPDLRGMFLRGVNDSRADGLKDPNATSRTPSNGGNSGDKVGSLQLDQFEKHKHGHGNLTGNTDVNTNSHQHNYTKTSDHINDNEQFSGSVHNNAYNDYILEAPDEHGSERLTEPSGAHTHFVTITGGQVASAGGSETRPNNAYVHYIIKL